MTVNEAVKKILNESVAEWCYRPGCNSESVAEQIYQLITELRLVQMDENQELPREEDYPWDEINSHSETTTWKVCQEVMLNAGFVRVKRGG